MISSAPGKRSRCSGFFAIPGIVGVKIPILQIGISKQGRLDTCGTAPRRQSELYAVMHTDGRWYLIGHCLWRQTLRTLSLDRVTDLELCAAIFRRPASFDPRSYLQDRMFERSRATSCRPPAFGIPGGESRVRQRPACSYLMQQRLRCQQTHLQRGPGVPWRARTVRWPIAGDHSPARDAHCTSRPAQSGSSAGSALPRGLDCCCGKFTLSPRKLKWCCGPRPGGFRPSAHKEITSAFRAGVQLFTTPF